MIIPSIPEPARIMNPVEGSVLNVPRKSRLAKLIRPINGMANKNIRYFRSLRFPGCRDLSEGGVIFLLDEAPGSLSKLKRLHRQSRFTLTGLGVYREGVRSIKVKTETGDNTLV
jgi:hypothetical protein